MATIRRKMGHLEIASGQVRPGNEDTADRVEQAIYDGCAFLAERAMRGHFRPDLTPRSLRFWTLTRYPN